ncbi:MAG: preprotein translocase subunit SecY [Candidatus Kapabacteria bacterium]|nr:preprotein translocase subunit SecY [Candidatus Kapabacteria bacterium]
MANIVTTFRNMFRIEELRDRIIFTLIALLAVRVGSLIAIPGIDTASLKAAVNANSADSGIFQIYNLFVGGAFENAAIFALGIMPYISASIILQIGGVVLPQLQKMQREGDDGRRKINQLTRVLTIPIAALQAWGVTIKLVNDYGASIPDHGLFWTISSVLIMTAGTVSLMWIGEQITDRGLGNGISLIIFIGIISRLPVGVYQQFVTSGADSQIGRDLVIGAIFLTLLLGIIAVVILITQGARRIPVQYAKRVVGRKVYGGTTQYIPLRVNTAGVMPIIFAQSILFIPGTIASFFPNVEFLRSIEFALRPDGFIYALLYGLMIVFFTYFYTAIAFNPKEVSDNMKKNGGFIPGVRPGSATAEYIENILTKITLPGAIFLAIIAILPTFAINVLTVQPGLASFFGGTSLLIVVGVALDTLQQIESYLLMRHYDGFMKTGKIRGRAGVTS